MAIAAGSRLAEQLADFRRDHPPRAIEVGGKSWRYIAAGTGDQSLLMLPGALGSAELGFQLIDWWAPHMRIIAPYYVAGRSLAETRTVLERILDAEGIGKTNVLGSSFGGTLAQSWTRAHPERTERMVLSHTIAPDPRYTRYMAVMALLVRMFPLRAGKALMRRKVDKILPEKFEARDFWNGFFIELADRLTKPYLVNLMRCMGEFIGSELTPADLDGWNGETLIIESDNDTNVKEHERAAVRALYPGARVHTFHGSGHASSVIEARKYAEIVAEFLSGRDATARVPSPEPAAESAAFS